MSREALEEASTVSELPTAAHRRGDAPEPDATVVRPLARPPAIGDVIAEKYRLMRTLGRGGMGRIFAADHLLLGTTVALKFMHPHLTRDRSQVSRFAREARAAAMLKSANSARIIDVDQLPTGELYIVMEYLEGTSLETMAVDGHGLPIADAVRYVAQACDALAEAHSQSIIHRDVKPANLFLTKGKSGEPVIKVLDFGLAKSMASSDEFSMASATVSGQALGTPYYMSPEQISGAGAIDGRSDVWAIGATLYELLTGHLAFGGATAPLVFDQILIGKPTPLRVHRPEIPESVVAIVERCLMLEITARFQTVRELLKALESSLLVVSTEPVPFVAAPLSTDRFVHSSAPPGPAVGIVIVQAPLPRPSYTTEASVRGAAPSIAPESLAGVEPEVAHGPSVRQTVLAALAGPALLAVAAGVVALMMSSSNDSDAVSRRPTVARESVSVKATLGDPTRSKAAPAPEKPDRSHR